MVDKNSKPSQQSENTAWIVPPGLRIPVLQFIDLCNLVSAPPMAVIKKKKPVIVFGDTGVGIGCKSLLESIIIYYDLLS